MSTVNAADISLRPARDGDEPFLKRVHEAARHWEFASLLQTGQADLYHKIMAQQYDSQHRFYFANYGTAHYGGRGQAASRFREQFSLLFSLPQEIPIGSEVLAVSHPALGQCDLLVTRVIDEAEGTALEICFA